MHIIETCFGVLYRGLCMYVLSHLSSNRVNLKIFVRSVGPNFGGFSKLQKCCCGVGESHLCSGQTEIEQLETTQVISLY